MKIVILRQDHLGDLVLTTPLIRALSLAGHQVMVIARRSSLPVLENNPHVTQRIAFEDIESGLIGGLGLRIGRLSPDLVLVPHAWPPSFLIALRMGYFGKVISMWGGPLSRLLGCRSLRSRLLDQPRHMADIWLDLARAIGVSPDGLKPEIFLSEEERSAGTAMIRQHVGSGNVVIIHPGCSGNTCNLPIHSYAAFTEMLLTSSDVRIILTGLPEERLKYSREFERFSGNSRVWNAMGELSLRQLCSLMVHVGAVVSVGTGPMHLASALGVSTISPFCQKVGVCSRVWGNLGAKSTVIEAPSALCAQRPPDVHCDFEGEIQPAQLLNATLEILNNH